MKKRFFSLLLVLFIAVTCLPALAYAEDTDTPQLQFGSDGSFTVLVLADTQDLQICSPFLVRSLIATLDLYTPDFIVLLGDQIDGGHPLIGIGSRSKNVTRAIDNVLWPIAEREIPFAVVFGNHDAESGVSREAQMRIYQSYPNCVAVDEGDTLPGCGTYRIPVYDMSGKSVAMNMYFFDSGDYIENGDYGTVTAEQVDWYRQEAAAVKAANDNQTIPAIAFQHIIVPEIYNILSVAQSDTPDAFAGVGVGKGSYYLPDAKAILSGELLEAPCPSSRNSGLFSAWKENDVFAAFFGHDHVNSFIASVEGLDLVACPGATYTSYNDEAARGARLLRFTDGTIRDYETMHVKFSAFDDVTGLNYLRYHLTTTGKLPNWVKIFVSLALLLIIAIVLIIRIARDPNRTKAADQPLFSGDDTEDCQETPQALATDLPAASEPSQAQNNALPSKSNAASNQEQPQEQSQPPARN